MPATYAEALERARALKPKLRERAAEAEQLRQLPAENVTELLESGLYGLLTPRRYGGSELGSETMIDVTIELASACPAPGWVYMLWTAHMWLLALFPEEAQDEVWANPNTLASSVVNTTGEVERVDGGYRWTGRGFFSSGVDHCNWLTAAVPIKSEDAGRTDRALLAAAPARGLRDHRRLAYGRPARDGQQDDRDQRRVGPRRRALSRSTSRTARRLADWLHAHPMYGAIASANFSSAMCVPALGVARGFLEAFEARLASKAGNIDDGLTVNMARYAHATAQIDAAYTMVLDNARRLRTVPAAEVTDTQRAKCRRDGAFAAQTARKVVNSLYEEGGGSSLFEKSDLQRYWRDANAAASHHGLTWDWVAVAWTRMILGSCTGPTAQALPSRAPKGRSLVASARPVENSDRTAIPSPLRHLI